MSKNIKQRHVKEIIKCGKDPIYFFNHYVKIQHPTKGAIQFNTFPFQDDCVADFLEHRYNIVLKARQLGLSTVTAAYALWMILFKKNANVLVIATKLGTAVNFISKCKYMLQNLPDWLVLPEITKETSQVIGTSEGSVLKAVPNSEDAGRSEALSLLIVDEAAFIRGFDELWKALLPTLSTGGRAVLLSCVVDDTWVFTSSGPQQVKNFLNKENKGGYEIPEYEILGKDKSRKGYLFHNNGKVKTKKIKTQHSWLEGSENHKVWAFSGGKYDWHRLDQLKEGDYIAYQYGMNVWGNNDDISDYLYVPSNKEKNTFLPSKRICKDLAYYFGMYLSEGSNYKIVQNDKIVGNNMTITCGDDISGIFENIGLNYSCGDGLHYTCSSKSLGMFFEYLGFDLNKKALEKTIPDRLMSMSKDNIRSMLSGLFDGDGYSRSDRGTIGISLSSKKMIEQIRVLLNNFGILTDYYEGTTPPTEKSKVSSKYYRIEINGRNSKKFYEEIGFRFNRKQNNLNEIKYDLSVKNTKDIVPNSLGLLNEIYSYSSKDLSYLKDKHNLFMNGVLNTKTPYKTKNISRSLCLRFFEAIREDLPQEKIDLVEKILSPNIKWDKIKSIEDGFEETYDFSLPDDEEDFWCHSVIYNGLLGHQTPNGTGNKFYKLYSKAEKKPVEERTSKDFNTICLPWSVHPERDQQWFEEQRATMSVKELAQEHECDFAASGDTFLDPTILEKVRHTTCAPECGRVGPDRNVHIWHKPEPKHRYILSADTARGDGKDYSAFHIIDVDEQKFCAEYQGKMPPDRFADLINEFGLMYNKALVCPENNNVGYATIQRLCLLQYPNIYNSKEKRLDLFTGMNKGDLQKPSGDLGIYTTGQKRNVLLTKMEEMLRNGVIDVLSDRLYKELKTFIWINNHKVGAESGENDDLVISFAIAMWLLDTSDYTKYTEEQNSALLTAMSRTSSNIDDFIDKQKQDDYSVLVPVAGNSGGFSNTAGKTNKVQVLNNKWSWLLK